VIVVPEVGATGAGRDPVPAMFRAGAAALVRFRAVDWGPRVRINLVVAAGAGPSPLGTGPVRPAEIAEAVYFLAGPGARFITGATLPVDRGAGLYWTMGGVGHERGGRSPTRTTGRETLNRKVRWKPHG